MSGWSYESFSVYDPLFIKIIHVGVKTYDHCLINQQVLIKLHYVPSTGTVGDTSKTS